MKALLVLSVVAVVGAGWIALQQRAVTRLRDEHGSLVAVRQEIERLEKQNVEMDTLRAQTVEVAQLRSETRDLYKLRNEVRQLREQAKGLSQVQSENQRLKAVVASRTNATTPPATPQTPTALDQVSFMGTETPEATLQSFFWAIRQENVQAFRNCLTPERQKEMELREEAEIRANMKELKSQFKGFHLVAKKEVSANEVHLGVQFYAENQQEQPKIALPFKRIGYEWKLDVAPP